MSKPCLNSGQNAGLFRCLLRWTLHNWRAWPCAANSAWVQPTYRLRLGERPLQASDTLRVSLHSSCEFDLVTPLP